MKKLYRIPAALCLCLMLCACAGEQSPPATPEPAVPAAAERAESALTISEVMAANGATLADEQGAFPDWLELHNRGDAPLSLAGLRLERDGESFPLPALSLSPGEYRLLFASQLPGLSIPKSGCVLRLLDGDGAVLDELRLPPMAQDQSACREEDGSLSLSNWPSPGQANSAEGYDAYQESRAAPEGEPVIGEVVVFNDRHLPRSSLTDEEHAYYDWVEISNFGSRPLSLKGYYLSDKDSDRLRLALPKRTLQPGESLVVLCTDQPTGLRYDVIAGFSLNSERETLYLSREDGSLVDYVSLHDIPVGCSLGRQAAEEGFFYFRPPSPGALNKNGGRRLAQSPEALTADGVFTGEEPVSLVLRGDDPIRYTLDGSRPTAQSPLYQGPLELRETCVVRAACFREGCLPSETLDLSYIIGEGHSLPVYSLVCDPEDLLGARGLYSQPTEDLERAASFSLYDGDERLSVRCGVKLQGESSKVFQRKKSLKLKFNERYEGALDHDLFGNGVSHFASLILRAAQEEPGSPVSSYMRDALMHSVAAEAFPALPCQDHRYGVLYLNGAYWGIYNLREAHSVTHYAQHYGYEESQVSHAQRSWSFQPLMGQLYERVLDEGLKDGALYEELSAHLDLDSIIGWSILEAYAGNQDSMEANMRFYWTEPEQVLHYALVDLDMGLGSYDSFSISFALGFPYNRLCLELMRNEDFRGEFLRQLSQALAGPLSPEAMDARIDAFAAELRDEIGRDAERWGSSVGQWESQIRHLHEFVRQRRDRGRMLLDSLESLRLLTEEERAALFGGL